MRRSTATHPLRVFRHPESVPAEARGAVLALGNFDGVHRGHQAVVAAGRRKADELGVPLGVVTFEPHPRRFFQPNAPEFRLTPLRTKAHHLQACGVDFMLVLDFDQALSRMLAQDFVSHLLLDRLAPVELVIGFDYSFGRGRAGNAAVLGWMSSMEGFGLTVVEPQADGGVVYSSTRVRQHLQAGEPALAAELLGHYWCVEARVETGDQRGRLLGFPTANLGLGGYLEPRLGVYAVRAETIRGEVLAGVANLGRRPTFDKTEVKLEVHLFDFSGSLYGEYLNVAFVSFIRPERKFDGLEALKAQIAADSTEARRLLAVPETGPG